MQKISKVKVKEDLKTAVEESVDRIGGMGNFIKEGDVVLVKPNFNTADPFPASTDINFLREVVSLIYKEGAKSVIVGESSTYSRNTRREMERAGVFDLQKDANPPKIHVLEEREWEKKTILQGRYLKKATVPKVLGKVDKLVLLPCLKTHMYAQFTGALKLSVGFMSSRERIPLHLRNLQGKIVDLNRIINPSLVIMDARKCFKNRGPAEGEVEKPNLIFASPSRVAVDIEGVKTIKAYKGNSLTKVHPLEIPQLRLAIEVGIGSEEYEVV